VVSLKWQKYSKIYLKTDNSMISKIEFVQVCSVILADKNAKIDGVNGNLSSLWKNWCDF